MVQFKIKTLHSSLLFVFSGTVRNAWCFITGQIRFFAVTTVASTFLNIAGNGLVIYFKLPYFYCAVVFVFSQAFCSLISTFWINSEDELFRLQMQAFSPRRLWRILN